MQYKLASDEVGLRVGAYNTFCTLRRELAPHITIMKPMTDLCWVCQQNSTAMLRAANRPVEEREVRGNSYITLLYSNMYVENQIVKDAEKHLLAATKARSYLKAQIAMAKGDLKAEYLDKGLPIPPINSSFPACSNSMF